MKNLSSAPVLKSILESYSIGDATSSLFHATTRSRARKIIKQGFLTDKCGEIHGKMQSRPRSPTVYLSKFETSSNLNSNLFESKEDIVVLEINPNFLDVKALYPDDGFFCAIGQEELFEDVEDILGYFDIPENEAELLLEATYEITDEISDSWKPFSMWYLKEFGEVSCDENISPQAVLAVFNHPESPNLNNSCLSM